MIGVNRDGVTVKMEGGDAVRGVLNKLPARIERKVLIKGLRAGAKVILKEARRLVPVRTGTLKRSLGIVVIRGRGKAELAVAARSGKQRKYDGWYAHLVEFGPVKSRAHPFLRPAMDAKEQEAVDEASRVIRDQIQIEVEKLVR